MWADNQDCCYSTGQDFGSFNKLPGPEGGSPWGAWKIWRHFLIIGGVISEATQEVPPPNDRVYYRKTSNLNCHLAAAVCNWPLDSWFPAWPKGKLKFKHLFDDVQICPALSDWKYLSVFRFNFIFSWSRALMRQAANCEGDRDATHVSVCVAIFKLFLAIWVGQIMACDHQWWW